MPTFAIAALAFLHVSTNSLRDVAGRWDKGMQNVATLLATAVNLAGVAWVAAAILSSVAVMQLLRIVAALSGVVCAVAFSSRRPNTHFAAAAPSGLSLWYRSFLMIKIAFPKRQDFGL